MSMGKRSTKCSLVAGDTFYGGSHSTVLIKGPRSCLCPLQDAQVNRASHPMLLCWPSAPSSPSWWGACSFDICDSALPPRTWCLSWLPCSHSQSKSLLSPWLTGLDLPWLSSPPAALVASPSPLIPSHIWHFSSPDCAQPTLFIPLPQPGPERLHSWTVMVSGVLTKPLSEHPPVGYPYSPQYMEDNCWLNKSTTMRSTAMGNHWFCGNKQRGPEWDQAEAIYSELAAGREAATITWVWQTSKAHRGVGKLHSGQRGKLQVHLAGDCWCRETGSGHPRWLVLVAFPSWS